MTDLSSCICCGNSPLVPVFSVTDHSVSGETFPLQECTSCGFRLTANAPDAAHIGPYYLSEDYISHTNTNRGIINRLYQLARVFTLRRKKRFVSKASPQQKGALLEIGAGTGYFAETMIKAGWQVTALEPDAGARQIARERAALELLPAEQLFQLSPAGYDIITLWHVLEHVHELSAYLNQFHRLLKPNGRLIIAVPNYTSADATHYGTFWAAYDVPRHLYHFSPRSMQKLLSRHQFTLTDSRPMWLDAFYVALLSEKYQTKRSRFLAGMFRGILSNLSALLNRNNTSSLIYVARKN